MGISATSASPQKQILPALCIAITLVCLIAGSWQHIK
jgi:hypothetical protein